MTCIYDMELIKIIPSYLGLCLLFYGIDSWRREHIGKRQVELAEDVLVLFYEAVDVIKYMRNPGSLGSEYNDIEKEDNENEKQYQARKKASIVFKRYNENQEVFYKLYAMRYRFMAQIGKDKTAPFNDLQDIINEIKRASMMLSYLWSKDYHRTREQEDEHHEKLELNQAIFWENWSMENDPINSKLNKVIDEIEKTCRSVIAGKDTLTLYRILNKKIGRTAKNTE